jgi:proteasome lid subunit RPN8/RPN11
MLTLTQRQYAHILAHAAAGAPYEVCGLVAGRGSRAAGVYRVPNVAENPRTGYYMEPVTLVRCFEHFDRRGWDLLGIYHSHPAGPGVPSETDIAQSYYPGAVYVIVSLAGREPSARAFYIRGGAFEETGLAIV